MIAGEAWESIIHGAAELEPGTAGAVVPHRLPAWARAQVDDAMLSYVEACPGGVALRFDTDATEATLTIGATTVAAEGADMPTIAPLIVSRSGEESSVPGPVPTVIVLSPQNEPIGVLPHAPQEITLPLPGSGLVEVLLPHNARIELVSLTASAPLRPASAAGLRWTHYGSSISQGLNAVSAARTWPVAAARKLGWNLRNLSFAGNAQFDGFAARMIRDVPADIITLKVGVNLLNSDSMRERAFRPAAHAFLDTIREGQPHTPIVLITALACPIHEETPGPVVMDADGIARTATRTVEQDAGALTLRRTREILAEVVAARPDPNLTLVDGQELFGAADAGLLYDRLHPDQEGLDLIAERFVERIAPLAGEAAGAA
ncbi:MAG: hypothetical protein BGN97_05150 [Microbacterium sp. 69-10]|uniref:SGNH/GDSL hydrolase family protein n=1 Tax=Microbacterium sp. 69-10 TaxID=1895783 RepID=UPI000960DFBB|nr:SGNH/GDSL hydrolase family protein [Microbacterium sp. 69-10]OJU40700.1 MAG: hypothetical protein BGN97_05150 [Microbacterium sp. 69-10]